MHRQALAFVILLLMPLVASGCGRPQVEPENLHLIASLRTALSARNSEWLEKTAEMVRQRHSNGEMSDEEFEQFQLIIHGAKAGDWSDAEKEALAFQKAQRPTDEQIARIRAYWR